jgi:uncharacterized membrane-anchored protein YitT (DUF2179 family)
MKIKMTKADLLKSAKHIALIIVGTLILALGTSLFMLPYDLVTGGISGYAIVLSQIIPSEILTVEVIITILTWVTFFLGLIFLGKTFAMKTLVSTIVYPIGVAIFSNITNPEFMGGFFNLQLSQHSGVGVLLAALFSGVLIGFGCALTFLGGGSTGGVDVIAFIACKIFKRLRSSVAIFVVDASAVLFGMFVIGDFVLSLLGIVSAFVAALVVDKVFIGGTKAFVAHIVTDKYEEINQLIIEKLDRTTTIVDVTGGYSKMGKKMLMVSFSMNEYSELMSIITKNDREAFLTVNQAHEIHGEGWTKHDYKI